MKKILSLIAVAATVVAVMAGCGSGKKEEPSASASIATIVCDQSFENIIAQEIDVFEYIYKNKSIIPYYVDEHAAIDSMMDLATKLIVTTRPLTEKQEAYLKGQKRQVRQSRIAVDAVALIVNPANSIEQLSVGEIAEILSGKVKTWDEVWPTKGLDSIQVVFDHQGSSTVQYMRDSLLNGEPINCKVFAEKSNQEVFDAVAKHKNAIGVIGVSWISSDMRAAAMSREERVASLERSDTINPTFAEDVKVLKVSGRDQVEAFAPYQYYIYDGSYPLYRSIYLICSGVNGSLSHNFYSFVTGFQGQKIIQATGVLPDIIHTQRVEVTK